MKKIIIILCYLAVLIPNVESVEQNQIDSVVVLDEFNISINELISLSKWGRNPFLPYYCLSVDNMLVAEVSDNIYQPVLKKIFWHNHQRCAKINDRFFQQGDVYLDMKILYIGEGLVILIKDNSPCLVLEIEK